ncbi:MAG: peptidoglycan DD-metalloendopeptidase family protein [Bacteroidota bacterium]
MRIRTRLALRVSLFALFISGFLIFKPAPQASVDSGMLPSSGLITLPETPEPAPVVIYDEFDFREDAFDTQTFTVKRNQTFSDMLSPFGISGKTVHDLAAMAKPMMDIRKIRAGNSYRIYDAPETEAPADFLVYQRNPVDYIVFDLQDSLNVFTGERPVVKKERHARGEITSSLYVTLTEQDVNPMLAIELSEVFAWQVDFYRIMKGDHFSVVYEEEFVGDKSIGVADVKAAKFHHNGEDYYAFPYEVDGRLEYYDENGNSLRRPFLRAPLRYSRISSRYSLRRFHPVQKRYKAHLGTDYAAPTGTPVHATADGVVTEAGYSKYNGRYVKVRHNSTYTTQYLHFSKIEKGVKSGVKVKQGDVIGYVGSTGLATGPHLCYRFWKNGKQVDALREKLPTTVEPIKDELRAEFEAVMTTLKPALD